MISMYQLKLTVCSYVRLFVNYCFVLSFLGGERGWWDRSSPNINPLMLLTKKEQKRAVHIIMQALTFRVDWNPFSIFRTLIASSHSPKALILQVSITSFSAFLISHQTYNVKAKACECTCTDSLFLALVVSTTITENILKEKKIYTVGE